MALFFRLDFLIIGLIFSLNFLIIGNNMDTKRQKRKLLTKVENHRRGKAYQPAGKNCGLCDLEKFCIIARPELASLNQRNELATSCRHRKNIYSATNKLILTKFKITHCHL